MFKWVIGIILGLITLFLITLFLYNQKLKLRFMKNNEIDVSKVTFFAENSILDR